MDESENMMYGAEDDMDVDIDAMIEAIHKEIGLTAEQINALTDDDLDQLTGAQIQGIRQIEELQYLQGRQEQQDMYGDEDGMGEGAVDDGGEFEDLGEMT